MAAGWQQKTPELITQGFYKGTLVAAQGLEPEEAVDADVGSSRLVTHPTVNTGKSSIGFVAPISVDDGPCGPECSNCSRARTAVARAMAALDARRPEEARRLLAEVRREMEDRHQ